MINYDNSILNHLKLKRFKQLFYGYRMISTLIWWSRPLSKSSLIKVLSRTRTHINSLVQWVNNHYLTSIRRDTIKKWRHTMQFRKWRLQQQNICSKLTKLLENDGLELKHSLPMITGCSSASEISILLRQYTITNFVATNSVKEKSHHISKAGTLMDIWQIIYWQCRPKKWLKEVCVFSESKHILWKRFTNLNTQWLSKVPSTKSRHDNNMFECKFSYKQLNIQLNYIFEFWKWHNLPGLDATVVARSKPWRYSSWICIWRVCRRVQLFP